MSERTSDLVFLANIWHELDDHTGALAGAARILAPEGRLAILDWRTDVRHPPGPSPERRISAGQTTKTLSVNNCVVRRSIHVGLFSYLILAELPAGAYADTEAA